MFMSFQYVQKYIKTNILELEIRIFFVVRMKLRYSVFAPNQHGVNVPIILLIVNAAKSITFETSYSPFDGLFIP